MRGSTTPALRAGARDLLPDDRREVAVERHHEGLDAAGAADRPRAPAGMPPGLMPLWLKTVALWKRKSVSTLPSCRKPKPRTWSPMEAVVAAVEERHRRHAEHADLLVHVPEVRDLEDLGLVLEARAAVGAEEARRGDAGSAFPAGSRRWQPSQFWNVSETGPLKKFAARPAAPA